ncbi:hypothetical protein WH52_09910 [Tenacibaculum holothuriorum]|uniref:Glycosyltransferase 2-like domain-containing protein n=1 Tax=Tenacibaculum holothuriorum TaxID=1635173 RepID=A0A1Y2PB90_9FLAO|nr:glycosyltransferase [Tenacibaculum holothuriorum]OSY87733.1 hypothetical protein WH52_09910 [Tenacibaculum holothuriorum]
MITNNSNTYQLVIVVPCYNEETRLPIQQFKSFVEQKENNNILICFVNDGSQDNTNEVLQRLSEEHPASITFLSLKENVGKAEAVRKGFLHCNEHFCYDKIAYLDADLATSLEECIRVSNFVNDEVIFAFGSRISKLDNNIKRKFYRFFIGRIIATLISLQLRLKVYDTQCGCKVFKTDLVPSVFKNSFISKWLFDVEIFHRLIKMYGRKQLHTLTKEVPLKAWLDTDDSRVEFTYMFKLWFDLLAIGRQYKK